MALSRPAGKHSKYFTLRGPGAARCEICGARLNTRDIGAHAKTHDATAKQTAILRRFGGSGGRQR